MGGSRTKAEIAIATTLGREPGGQPAKRRTRGSRMIKSRELERKLALNVVGFVSAFV
jgi:hypothetical protein